jgi:hypothetical protein
VERTLAETESRVAQLAREAERLSEDAARLRRVTTRDPERPEELAERMATVTVTETERPRHQRGGQIGGANGGGCNSGGGSPHEATVHLWD